tara:strand:- start:226 stop:669 length:444 start_codon:yes stop_codon:yes gene_type:complete
MESETATTGPRGEGKTFIPTDTISPTQAAYAQLGIAQPDATQVNTTIDIAAWVMMSQEQRVEMRWDFDIVTITANGEKFVITEATRGKDSPFYEDAWKQNGCKVTAPEWMDSDEAAAYFHAIAQVSGFSWYWIQGNDMIVNEMDTFA